MPRYLYYWRLPLPLKTYRHYPSPIDGICEYDEEEVNFIPRKK